MTHIEHSALVHHSCERMYQLVHDVPAYPQFLNWCAGAQIISEDEALQVASIQISIKGVSQRFATDNALRPHERIGMRLRDGPFSRLEGEWLFKTLGEEGCKVSLQLDFEFANPLLAFAFKRGFTRVANHLVEDFRRRADELYG